MTGIIKQTLQSAFKERLYGACIIIATWGSNVLQEEDGELLSSCF